MSGKVPKKSALCPEEKNTWRADPDPRRHVRSSSNPNEVRAQGKNASQRLRTGIEYPAASASRNMAGVSSSKGPDVCSGSAALGIQALSQSNPKKFGPKTKISRNAWLAKRETISSTQAHLAADV